MCTEVDWLVWLIWLEIGREEFECLTQSKRVKSFKFKSKPRLNLVAAQKINTTVNKLRLFSSSNISERILIVKISLVHCDEVDTNSLDFHSSFHEREEAPEQDLLFDVHLYLSYFGR